MTADREQLAARADAASRGLPLLQSRLLDARRRWRLRTVLHGAVWSMAFGLAVFCALATANLLTARAPVLPMLPAQPFANQLAAGAIAFACALAVACLTALLRAPDLPWLARAADRKFALRERLSTALEVAATRSPNVADDPIRMALLTDAEKNAGSIDTWTLVSLRLPRAAWSVPVLLAAAVLLQAVPPDAWRRATPDASAERSDASLSRRQAEDTAANLRHIAELLDRDAAQRSDPYLRTIARTLERLSADLAGAPVDRSRLAGELSQLLAHTRQAYANGDRLADGSPSPRRATELLRSALDEITGRREPAVATAEDPAAAATKTDAADRSPPRSPSPALEHKATGEPRSAEQIAAALRRMAGGDVPWFFVDEDGAAVDPRSQLERLMAEEERRARAAAQPSGAAANAGRGDGDRAGDGVQPLGQGSGKAPDLVATGRMLLPEPQSVEGRRIRIEIPPNAALSEVAAPTSVAGEGWRRAQEQPVEHPTLDAEDLRVVGRYFKRSSGRNDPRAQGPVP
jgi:hypothetical protein